MESGWDRLRDLFDRRRGEEAAEELQFWPVVTFSGSCVGFLFGGLMGARYAADKHVQLNKSTLYPNQMQAQRELHSAAMMGFARVGARWGWRLGAFAGLYSAMNIAFAVYRDRDDALNMTAAGAISGGLFRIRFGLKPFLGGIALGSLVSFPFALLLQGLDHLLLSEKDREARREKSRILKEARLQKRKQQSEEVHVLTQRMEDELSGRIETTATDSFGLSQYFSLSKPSENEGIPEKKNSSNSRLHNAWTEFKRMCTRNMSK